MYEEYLHSLTSSITNGQTLVKHAPLPLQVYVLIGIHLTARAFPTLVSC